MNYLETHLGRVMTAKEVAEYLQIDMRTVRKYYLQLGGVRLGKAYRFFERRINDAIQTQWKMVRPGQDERQNQKEDISDQKTSHRMGGRTVKERGIDATRDPFNLLD